MEMTTHEVFHRDERIVTGSDRSFGVVTAAALVVVTLLNAWHSGRLWPSMRELAALFLAVTWLRPTLLNPLNRVWMKFGLLLHSVVNPVVMAARPDFRM